MTSFDVADRQSGRSHAGRQRSECGGCPLAVAVIAAASGTNLNEVIRLRLKVGHGVGIGIEIIDISPIESFHVAEQQLHSGAVCANIVIGQ